MKAAQASGLQQKAAVHRNEAATSRDQLNEQWDRADTMDPDTQTPDDTPRQDSETCETPRGPSAGKQGPPPMPDLGDVANPRRPEWSGSSPIDRAAATLIMSVDAIGRLSPPAGGHVTCDISHSSTAPDDSSSRLERAPNV